MNQKKCDHGGRSQWTSNWLCFIFARQTQIQEPSASFFINVKERHDYSHSLSYRYPSGMSILVLLMDPQCVELSCLVLLGSVGVCPVPHVTIAHQPCGSQHLPSAHSKIRCSAIVCSVSPPFVTRPPTALPYQLKEETMHHINSHPHL